MNICNRALHQHGRLKTLWGKSCKVSLRLLSDGRQSLPHYPDVRTASWQTDASHKQITSIVITPVEVSFIAWEWRSIIDMWAAWSFLQPKGSVGCCRLFGFNCFHYMGIKVFVNI